MKDTESHRTASKKGTSPMPGKIPRAGRYMPGLDGLRALSVLAVIAYHFDKSWAPGGLLGVGVFFVLSGYLITDQLLSEWSATRRIDLAGFWGRRARRLLPAMLLMLVCVALWLALTDRSRLSALSGDFVSAILYVNNWWLIFHEVSYFESFGPPSPIGHLWSLAIEEQFYLLWPLALAVGMPFLARRGKWIALLLLGTLASAAAMALLFEPGSDPSRVYYGTDTRAFALLIGAALAVAWPSRSMPERVSGRTRAALDAVGAASLALIVWMMADTAEYGSFLYYGGLLLLSAISALAIAALSHPASRLAKAMGSKPLRWLGVRSYSLYVWHYPVIVLTTPAVDTNGPDYWRIGLQLAASVALASLSWKYVEEPIRRGALKRLSQRFKAGGRLPSRGLWIGALCTMCLLAVSFNGAMGRSPWTVQATTNAGIDDWPDTIPSATETAEPVSTEPVRQPPVEPSPSAEPEPPARETPNRPKTDHPANVGSKEPDSARPEANGNGKGNENGNDGQPPKKADPDAGKASPSKETPGKAESGAVRSTDGSGVTAIGDSVILDAAPYLEKLLPGIVVDGKVGRQMTQALETVEALDADGQLGHRVIIELGTNGSFHSKHLRKLLDALGDKREIWLVNARVPRPWKETVNSALAKAAEDYGNVRVIDWLSASKGKDEYFSKDGVHLKRSGAEAYASLLANEVGEARE